MRPYAMEPVYDLSPLAKDGLSLTRPCTIDVDVDGRLYITDYPELEGGRRYNWPGRNRTRIVTYHPETRRRADLEPPELDGFQADMLKLTPSGELFLVQFGQWPEGKINGVRMSPGGEIRQCYRFGEAVADFSMTDDGKVFVIYNEEGYFGGCRSGQPLIELFGPDGEKIEDCPMLDRVLDRLGDVYDGNRIHVLRDGGLLVNGRFAFDADGNEIFRLSAQYEQNITVVDEYDNIFFIPRRGGGLFLLIPARGAFAECGLDGGRPIDFGAYSWFNVVRNGKLYLLNLRIPRVEVYELLYG